jgi:hypothetical protein
MTGQRQIKIRAYWEDARGNYYGLEKLLADAATRGRVLAHWKKYVRSQAATNGDRRQFKVLLDYLLRHGTLAEQLAGLAKSLNKINFVSCKDYKRSVARIFHRAGFEVPDDFVPGPGAVITYGDGEQPWALACGSNLKWALRPADLPELPSSSGSRNPAGPNAQIIPFRQRPSVGAR